MDKRRKLLIRGRIALDHVNEFYKSAEFLYKFGEIDKALHTGKLIRWFIKSFGLGFPNKWKKIFFCKKCKNLLFPGINLSVRVRGGSRRKVVLRCNICGSVKRFHLY